MRLFQKNHGIITVFVTLMMVPIVTFTGIMVDLSRYKLMTSQAVMAADSYGEMVLSEYDNVLKEMYGLFSVTQNEKGKEQLEQLQKYVKYSFNPSADSTAGYSGFMPYKTCDMQIEYKPINDSSLANSNVMLTQVGEFMQYRIVEEVLKGDGVYNAIGQFSNMESDMNAMDSMNELSKTSQDALTKIQDYYKTLEKINGYPSYVGRLRGNYGNYATALDHICNSDEYEKYVNYLKNKDAIDEARAKEQDPNNTTELSDEEKELASQYVDADKYKQTLKNNLADYEKNAYDFNNDQINFDSVDGTINDLKKYAKDITNSMVEIENQVNQLKAELPTCSEDVKEGVQKEIEGLDEIVSFADEFQDTYDRIATINNNKQKNKNNKENLNNALKALDEVNKNIIDGKIEPKKVDWNKTIDFEWYNFLSEKHEFYDFLVRLCTGNSGEGNKNAGQEKIDKANETIDQTQKELDSEETPEVRDIGSLAGELDTTEGKSVDLPGITDYFSGSLSVTGLGNELIDRFLLSSYDFGMFSSRVTGVKPEEKEETSDETATVNLDKSDSDEYKDYSLTEVEMCRDYNYLYGGELEYLLGGHNESKKNLNETRNIILGVRETMNFVSTYSITEINDLINAIADTAASAVAASGVGAAAAPLVRVAVSGALRLAVASVESAADWKLLMERKSVPLLKQNIKELSSLDKIEALIGKIEDKGGKPSIDIKLSYENYLNLLIYLVVDTNTLVKRTSALITLNVNQSQNKGNTLSSLEFRMQDTVTAVNATCKVKMDFVIVPDNFMEMFASGTSTETTISSLENSYFGYSVIRGY